MIQKITIILTVLTGLSIFPAQLRAQEKNGNPVKITQDSRIDSLMAKYTAIDRQHKGMTGYRIQLYSGSGTNARKEAHQIEADFLRHFPNVETYIIYNEPYFKTRVGNFRTKAEGYKLYKEIRRYFPNCYYVIEQNMDFPALKKEDEE